MVGLQAQNRAGKGHIPLCHTAFGQWVSGERTQRERTRWRERGRQRGWGREGGQRKREDGEDGEERGEEV